MKWFKHMSSASESTAINHLMDEFGPQGYAWLFMLIEICAAKWDGKSEPRFRFHQRVVRQRLRVTQVKMERYLDRGEVLNQWAWKKLGKEFEFYIPKLLEIKDNHASNLKVTSKLVSLDKKRIEEKRREESIAGTLARPKAPPKSEACWQSFLKGNLKRYGTKPSRNAQVNSQLCGLVDKIGASEAPKLIDFYFSNVTDPFVCKKFHPLGTLVSNYQEYNTRMNSGISPVQSMSGAKSTNPYDNEKGFNK